MGTYKEKHNAKKIEIFTPKEPFFDGWKYCKVFYFLLFLLHIT